MQPLEYCREKVLSSRSNFLAGFRFLEREKRDALLVLYAFCRELDDVADDCSDAAVANISLQWWRGDLAKVFSDGLPEHPVNRALQQVAADFSLPHEELSEIIEGMQMDLQQVRYADFAALSLYCHRVAGVVGCLIARILGFSNVQTLLYAEKQGLALQLTNIIRDVGEDARMGRIYLPQDECSHFNVTEDMILQARLTPEFAALMDFQIKRTQQTYREARVLLPSEDYKKQKAGLVMAAVYYALLQEIRRDGAANVLRYKTAIPSPRKKRIALKTWLFGFNP
ncbi:squalene synthase HpnD [Neisseria sp. KEM232]|uniref:presqualene diphosphate synthase HpnD n=1 Tax=unclassified Neisseria TaxID=2623750 RepID=UPI000568B752|nr:MULTISPECIES: presqualene diphosphate synthase HpnD [unclassified Neisseria]ASP18113.1 squalene synthase HpnD [Neisseria sp. KEM232]